MDPKCLCKMIPDSEIEKIKADLPKPQNLELMSKIFKVFGDGTRLKILYFLCRHELCVADLATLAEMQQSAVSHQLQLLRLHRLVKFRREGTTIYYSIDDLHVQSVFDVALEHISENRRQ